MAHVHLNPVQRIRLFNYLGALPGSGSGFKLMDRLERAIRVKEVDAKGRKDGRATRKELRECQTAIETARGADRDALAEKLEELQERVDNPPMFKVDAPLERFTIDESDAEMIHGLTRSLADGERKDAGFTNADYRVFGPLLEAIDAAKASTKDGKACALCKRPRNGAVTAEE